MLLPSRGPTSSRMLLENGEMFVNGDIRKSPASVFVPSLTYSGCRQGAVGPFGENLAIMSGTNNNVAQAIKMWNDEEPEYNPNSPVASHYTQVIWKDSTQLGCAVVACNIASFAGGATSNFYVVSFLALLFPIPRADYIPVISASTTLPETFSPPATLPRMFSLSSPSLSPSIRCADLLCDSSGSCFRVNSISYSKPHFLPFVVTRIFSPEARIFNGERLRTLGKRRFDCYESERPEKSRRPELLCV